MIPARDESGRIAVVVTDAVQDRIVAVYAEAKSMQRTAEIVGVGYGSVQRVLSARGVSRRTYGGEVVETKVCIHCGEEKPLVEFRKNARAVGWRNECTRCQAVTDVCRRYGITREQYEEMWRRQGGRCAICGCRGSTRHARGKSVLPLMVDHDHGTGDVRGLLCNTCNTGIGMLGDDPEMLEEAAAYLREYGCP